MKEIYMEYLTWIVDLSTDTGITDISKESHEVLFNSTLICVYAVHYKTFRGFLILISFLFNYQQ